MAVLGLADHLSAGSRTADEPAMQSGARASTPDRLLRAFSALGLRTRDEEVRVSSTPLGERLRSDAPDFMKPRVSIRSPRK